MTLNRPLHGQMQRRRQRQRQRRPPKKNRRPLQSQNQRHDLRRFPSSHTDSWKSSRW